MADQEKFFQWLEQKADSELRKADTLLKRANKKIPPEYHDFLTTLDNKVKLYSSDEKKLDIPSSLKKKNCYSTAKGIYIQTQYPYFGADGRIKMATDEHQRAKKALYIKTAVNPTENGIEVDLGSKVFVPPQGVVAFIESEIRGIAYGTASLPKGDGKSQKFSSMLGKDYEATETAAVSRALSFMGYGIFGSAFQEEIELEKHRTEYQDAVSKMKEIQKEKEVSDVQLKKLAGELGIQGKSASLEDIQQLIVLLEKHKTPAKKEEKKDGQVKSESTV